MPAVKYTLVQYSEELSNRGVLFSVPILKALLSCYARMGKMERAIDILEHMESSGTIMQMEAYTLTMYVPPISENTTCPKQAYLMADLWHSS